MESFDALKKESTCGNENGLLPVSETTLMQYIFYILLFGNRLYDAIYVFKLYFENIAYFHIPFVLF